MEYVDGSNNHVNYTQSVKIQSQTARSGVISVHMISY